MRYAKIVGQAAPIYLFGMLPRKLLQFVGRRSPSADFSRVSTLKLRRQIERIGWHHSGKHVRCSAGAQILLDSISTPRTHSIRKDGHYLGAQFVILCGSGQEFFASSLVECNCMQLGLTDIPPSRQDRTRQQARRHFLPDQSLDIFRLNEVLFEFGQNIRQICKRANKTSASASRRTLAEELRGTGLVTMSVLPGSVATEMLEGSGFAPQMSPEEVAETIVYAALDKLLASLPVRA